LIGWINPSLKFRLANSRETIKLQRCLVVGYRGLIMRPDSHEIGARQFHGKSHLELMGQKNFRQALGLINESTIEVQVDGDEGWWLSGI
jgi:hypothetical protein